MPLHALLAVIALALSAVAATLAIVYALGRTSRGALRWPLLAMALGAFVLVIVIGQLGHPLLDAVKSAGTAAELAAAEQHAHGSDALAVSLFVLLVVVLSTIWKALSPRKERWNTGATISAVLLSGSSIAVIISGVIVLTQALEAVSLGHPSWSAG